MVIAAGIGFYLDSYAGTEPLLLAVGFVIGGIAAVRRLLRISADGLDGGSTPGASDRTPPPRAGDEPSPRDAANPPDA